MGVGRWTWFSAGACCSRDQPRGASYATYAPQGRIAVEVEEEKMAQVK